MNCSVPSATLTGDAIGIIMKEMVSRAIRIIHTHQFAHEIKAKPDRASGSPDFVTNVDIAAQSMYARLTAESFPHFGLVAEEDGLRRYGKEGFENTFFTVDPLDGTKAFIRREPTGVGTMISLTHNGEIIAAYVGDVMAEEIYGFRPGSKKTHRINRYGTAALLEPQTKKPLREQYIALRSRAGASSGLGKKLAQEGALCKESTVLTGSIGMTFTRLWGGSVGAVLLPQTGHTPWDFNPVLGITKHMGFGVYSVSDETGVTPMELGPLTEDRDLPDLLFVHPSFEAQIMEVAQKL